MSCPVTEIVPIGGAVDIVPAEAPVVDVVSGGPPGPQGPPGLPPAHVHTQAIASAEWIVNHNLGFRPFATVLSVGGAEIEAAIVHMSDNQLRVFFASPQSGSVRCL